MASDLGLATWLLPDQPGWVAEPASRTESPSGTALHRLYARGPTQAVVRATAGPAAAAVVATMMNFPVCDTADGPVASRTWLLRNCKAHLVQSKRGLLHSLSVILRGEPGDLAGSVMLEATGRHLPAADAVGLLLGLDWDAIRADLAGHHPLDRLRIAAAAHPAPVPADDSLLLWPMMPSVTTMEQMDKLQRRRPPRFAIANADAIYAAMRAVDEQRPDLSYADRDGYYFAAGPAPRLVITQSGFAPDYLWPGIHLASARLRAAFGLGPDAVEYGEVDATGSMDAVRAADYKTFRLVHRADPVDLCRMHGHEPDREADGSPTVAWLMSNTGPHATPRRTVWREGFVAPAPLFRDAMGRFIATETLADRVTRAGVTDVMFQDVTGDASLRALTLRTSPGAAGQ